jgi:hypothetical protein
MGGDSFWTQVVNSDLQKCIPYGFALYGIQEVLSFAVRV